MRKTYINAKRINGRNATHLPIVVRNSAVYSADYNRLVKN